MTLALVAAMFSTGAMAQDGAENKNKPVFTTIKELPITSIKDQNRSGTCWAYSVLTVRMHGDSQFSQGGSAGDVLDIIKRHGICPENAMPLPGTMQGDSLANFNEFFEVMSPYVDAVAKSKAKKISNQWKPGLQGILDAYLGKCPETFVYEGKTYTPKQFAESLGINWDDYVSITSYTHHPFYTAFPVEVQDNWRWDRSYNVPMDEMMRIIDNALDKGYTIAWGGDVSEEGFTRKGLGIAYDTKAVQSLAGSDAARWLKLSSTEKKSKLDSLGVNAPEIVPTQEMRQEGFDNWELTDDHGMHIYGLAKDQNGKEYYMVKNSWGEYGDYKGTWYMTKAFVAHSKGHPQEARHLKSRFQRPSEKA